MLKHLKDNKGLHPIWPALIIAFVTVLIVFIGILLLWSDSPVFAGIMEEWREFLAWVSRIFNPTPYKPIN
ncbi:MAG: hypothetical protein IJZ68_07555 [Bacteroidaceae bacterium]|nr:hypothetical protein [Bacteroidaceae bacterium]